MFFVHCLYFINNGNREVVVAMGGEVAAAVGGGRVGLSFQTTTGERRTAKPSGGGDRKVRENPIGSFFSSLICPDHLNHIYMERKQYTVGVN
jgi:hypothetical protein